jgi:predicted solute-binding protein
MTTQAQIQPPRNAADLKSLGVVSFLNSLPLYRSLVGRADVAIQAEVPSRLVDLLLGDQCDCAMLPVVDYFRHREALELVSDGCIASDGETLTVRVFSKTPPERLDRLSVDGDSHTSIILAQLIWRELYDKKLELTKWQSNATAGDVDSVLLIGDKVVRNAPRGFGFEVDLGAAWKHLTGLPFVFAAWFARRGADHSELAAALAEARDRGVLAAEQIAREHAASHGWPEAIAVEYLCRTLKFKLTPPMHEAMGRFFSLSQKHGLLP